MPDPREPRDLRPVLERRLLRAIFTAVGSLSRAARGESDFKNDRHFHACTTLARLAPTLLRPSFEEEEIADPIHPAYRAEAYELLKSMQKMGFAAAAADPEQRANQQLEQQQNLLSEEGQHHE
jgi:hypothetical protein